MNARECRRHATWTSVTAPLRAPAARWLVAIVGVLGAAGAGGCGKSAPHGPPVLQQIFWETRGSAPTLVWSSIPSDAAVATTVPPAATQFDLVFDRVIDGSKVEDTVTINGVSRQQPKTMPPVTVTWPDKDAQVAQLTGEGSSYALTIWYNSIALPVAQPNTSYVYGRETPSYPSNTTLSISIDANGITSEYDEPMVALAPITVQTAPFSVAINPAAGSGPTAQPSDDAGPPSPVYVPTNFWVPLQFNNIPVDVTAFATKLPQYLQVRQNGVLLTAGQYQLQASASDPTLILLQPGSIVVWDSGAQLDVTLSADLPDLYGSVLGREAKASFIPCQLVGEDAGVRICAPPSHPGGADGGAADASVDAGAVVPPVDDAGVDGSDAAADVAADATSD